MNRFHNGLRARQLLAIGHEIWHPRGAVELLLSVRMSPPTASGSTVRQRRQRRLWRIDRTIEERTRRVTANTINTDALFFTSLVTPEAIEHVNNALMKRIVEVAAAITSNPRARVWFLGGGASLAAM